MHELLAHYLETTYPEDPPIDVITYHYSRSDNLEKKRGYLRKCGERAQTAYSNETALEYYKIALTLSPGHEEAIELHLNSGIIYQLIGERDKARVHFQQALQVAALHHNMSKIVDCEIKMGNAWTLQAEYSQANEWLEKAHTHALEIDDLVGLCDVLREIGIIHWRRADFEKSEDYLHKSIDLARQLNDKKKEAYALSVLGQLKAQAGKLTEAHLIFEKSLAVAREMNDKRRISGTLNNFATTYYYEGNYEMAQELLTECLSVAREIGDKRGVGLALNNLGNVFYVRDDFAMAQKYYEEALSVGRGSGDKYVSSLALTSLGITLFRQGKLIEAGLYYQESLGLNREINDKVGLSLLHCYLGLLALVQNQPGTARKSLVEGLTISYRSDFKPYVVYNLIGMAGLFGIEGKLSQSVTLLAVADTLAASLGFKIEPELQEPYEKALAECREKLSEQEFQSAWQAGSNMKFEQAVQFALEN